jgi:hypothetical protein
MQDVNEVAGSETEAIDSPEVTDAADESNAVSEDDAEAAEGDDAPAEDGEIDKEMKTIKKALNKKNRYIDNQRARIRALEAEMQKLQASFGQNKVAAPDLEKFDSVLDYVDAKQTYTFDQKMAEFDQQRQMAHLQQQQNAAREAQNQAISAHLAEIMAENPDVAQTIKTNAPLIGQMPEHIAAIMYEIDNAPAATYALAKEGRLLDVYSMPPHVAVNYLIQAEQRGLQYMQQAAKPVKPAPAPIGAIRGAGKSSQKPLGQMSPSELDKWRKS